MSLTDQAKQMFNAYQTKVNAISPDLRPEIIQDKKAALRKDFFTPAVKIVAELQEAADGFGEARAKYSDPKTMLIFNCLKESDKINLGDAALINSLGSLPESMLDTIAGQTKKPGILLSLLGHAEDNADLRSKILSQVELPQGDIRSAAREERDCLQTLVDLPDLQGITQKNPTDRLTWGRRLNELDEILA